MHLEEKQLLLSALKNNILAVWILSGFVGIIAIVLWLLSRKFSIVIILLLVFLALLLATLNYFQFYKRKRHLRFAINMQSASVLLLMTAGIHFSGGISSPLLWLYILSIVVEGMSLGKHRAFTIATLSNALLVSLVALEYARLLPTEGFLVDPALTFNSVFVSTHLVSIVLFNYLLAFAVYFWAGKLFKQQEELRALDKAKDLFLSATSHELRTPLTPIKAQVQLLMSGFLGELSVPQKESLEMVHRNLIRLEKLVGDVMDMSRISAGKLNLLPVKDDLARVIGNVVEIEQPIASVKNIRVVFTKGPCVAFNFDPDRITQVLINLLDNAIKFTGKNGVITVSMEERALDVLVSVADDGQGLSNAELPRLFIPFYQAVQDPDKPRKGTGLGLVICKGIVEAHGGRIWCEKNPGRGVVFRFTLPLKAVA